VYSVDSVNVAVDATLIAGVGADSSRSSSGTAAAEPPDTLRPPPALPRASANVALAGERPGEDPTDGTRAKAAVVGVDASEGGDGLVAVTEARAAAATEEERLVMTGFFSLPWKRTSAPWNRPTTPSQ
jgi:hypothetical protein